MILIIKHIASEGPGTILDFIINNKLDYKILELNKGDALPKNLDGISHVAVMGGPMNVYEEDKYHFLRDENKLIKLVIEKEIPYLGVCLGAQLLAKACGAKAYKALVEEIGWSEVEISIDGKTDRLFENIAKKIKIFQWHGDTFDIPKNGILLAYGAQVVNQAFRVGKCAYGFQFHIEINFEILKEWFVNDLKLQNKFVGYYQTIKDNYDAIASEIYGNFFLKMYN